MNNKKTKKLFEEDLKALPLNWFEVFEEDGLKCLVRRTEMGHVNGYVKVPVDLPYKERSSFGEFAEENFSVHGGVTFTGSLEMLGVDFVKDEIKTLASQIKKHFGGVLFE